MKNRPKCKIKLQIRFLLVCILFFCSAFNSFSQITVNVKDKTIRQIIKVIENKSDYKIFYNDDFTALNKVVSLNVKDASIDHVMNILFKGSGISWKMKENKQIVLVPEKVSDQTNQTSDFQTHKLTGVVKDADTGEPLFGVSAFIEGTRIGTVSDIAGKFTIEVPKTSSVLVFSYIGYITKKVAFDKQSTIEVTMNKNSKNLDEVVVVGYGTQKKVNLTGAVSQIKFDELGSTRPIITVSSALGGLSSGVNVRQASGEPGSDGATIRIRGIGTLNNSDPLVIVDGMESSLDVINPQDIASISILKDAASSAIYGSRAANGVILVTTKSGDKQRVSVTYTGMLSNCSPIHLIDFVSDYPTYMRLMNESASNYSTAQIFSDATISKWETANKNPNALNANGVPNYIAFPNTDWNDVVYNTNNVIQNHNISVSGATSNSRLLISAHYLHNPGLVDNTGLKRYNFRTNAEVDVNKWLTIGTRTYATMDDNEMGSYGLVPPYILASTPGVYPYYDGAWAVPEAPEESATANNVLRTLHTNLGFDKTSRVNTSLYTKVKLFKGLTWNVNFNYNKDLSENAIHSDPTYGILKQFSTGVSMGTAIPPSNQTTSYSVTSDYQYTLETLLNYQITLAEKHHLSGLLGYNETYYNLYANSAAKKGLTDVSAWVLDAATNMISISGSGYNWSMRSVFGRINYDYNQRYLFEANFRCDGSSRFSSNHRWGIFPSFSAGWRISEENFMKDQQVFQNLKLRASWGELGNSTTPGYYDYMATYVPGKYSFNGTPASAVYGSKIANELLEWESTAVTNIGLETAFLGNRLTAEFEAYSRNTDGILTTPPVEITLGTASPPTQNLAGISNKGVELTLGWQDHIGDFKYSIKGNVSFNKNEVTKYKGKFKEGWTTDALGNRVYSSNLGSTTTGTTNLITEGHQINEYYMYSLYNGNQSYFDSEGKVNAKGGPKDGMIRTPQDMEWLNAMIAAGNIFMPNQSVSKTKIWYGDYIYADNNGNGIFGDSYDRKLTGTSSMPTTVFGLQMNFSWKNFDLGMDWTGQTGNQIYWLQMGYNMSNTRVANQIGKMVADNHYYYNDADPADAANNTTALYPRLKLNNYDTQNALPSTRWLYDGTYVRLSNVTLGYTLPQNITKKISIQQARFFISAENLLTITSYPGLDPEQTSSTSGNFTYPLVRQIAFGTNITF
ncbi:MAG: SusC/RagA family TonB-linked outer membrane protein [Bacteroidales bacterium]|nr:SusC/RagA family TonB-linked outer membrane protein [Bacteroidales bacterium]